jgi:hypothetical protein
MDSFHGRYLLGSCALDVLEEEEAVFGCCCRRLEDQRLSSVEDVNTIVTTALCGRYGYLQRRDESTETFPGDKMYIDILKRRSAVSSLAGFTG